MSRDTPAASIPVRFDVSLITADDLFMFNEGSHFRLYDKLGAHLRTVDGTVGTYFAVWAPDAAGVYVMGDFNGWNGSSHPLRPRERSGIWEGFVPGVGHAAAYKYHIVSRYQGYEVDKADPFAFHAETPPRTASKVWSLDYEWHDQAWLANRGERQRLGAPLSIYELHAGSWRRIVEDGNRWPSYRELAPMLAEHVQQLGFTHVEFLPVMEHPFYGSWGYQVTGYFAPTSRYGTPQDFMYLIDYLHQRGIGVILDWVPSHYPTDEHGLIYFDGTHLYEHSDPQQGIHRDWNTAIFNYGRDEVRSFLISNALFWLDQYHVDGLRVDAVASMLYLDYSRRPGEWVPNRFGGRENLEALAFLRRLNEEVYRCFPDVHMIAEESTAWPGVSRPTYLGGLGFGLKWDMGWMHDTLEYLKREPVHRKYHHHQLTFRMVYAFHENFVLALSHDEVVHGKGSLLARMPGDDWQKFANLRLLLGYLWTQPGKKLLFMGGEFGQWNEWNHETSLDWHLLGQPPHQGVSRLVADLNRLYRQEPALHQLDCDPAGFQWIEAADADRSVLVYLRRAASGERRARRAERPAPGPDGESTSDAGKGPPRALALDLRSADLILVACNFTPLPRHNYRVGVPRGGVWKEIFNSDAREYGGSGVGNQGGREAAPIRAHGQRHALNLVLPPLGLVMLKPEARGAARLSWDRVDAPWSA